MKHFTATAESGEAQPAALLVRVAARRAHPMIAYLSILATSVAAFAGAPMWAVLPGAIVLLSLSLIEQRKLSSRFAAIGASYMLTMAAWQSAGEALIAAGAAYGLGAVTRFLILV
jgi:hypothetical protein